MKDFVFIIVFAFLIYGCNPKSSASQQKITELTTLRIDTIDYWFGNVSKSDGPINHNFVIYNIGNNNLIINEVGGGCHCMTAVYTKSPIAPGDSVTISVTYDVSDPVGYFSRSIYVYSNSNNNPIALILRGTITE